MQFPIMIGLHRSRFLAGALLLAHGLVIAGILATPWPQEIRAALFLLGLISLIHALRESNILVETLHLFADGHCAVVRVGGQAQEICTLLPGFFIHPLLTVFRLQTDDATLISVVALPDTMSAEDHRRLRVWLRHKAKIGADDDV